MKLIRDLKQLFKSKSETISDPNFGNVQSEFDQISNSYYLVQNVEFSQKRIPLVLYVETKSKVSTLDQRKIYDYIERNFNTIWSNILKYLAKVVSPIHSIERNYQIESITIESQINAEMPKWEISLANQIDGFSRMIIVMNLNKPESFNIEA